MTTAAEDRAMARALALAATDDFVSGGNPRVGCVLLSPSGEAMAEGWHRGAGTDHAEVMALRSAGPAASGCTAVVTLEPCRHTGRTGPCTTALLAAGVSRVVFGQADPDPVGAGGAQELAGAGVEVVGPVAAEAAAAINHEWTVAVSRGLPYVILKLATTLDGRAAAADGSSRWITGPAAREEVHRLRAGVDAVMVGTGTVIADDPSLTARTVAEPRSRPLRVVVGLREPSPDARVMDASAPTLHLATRDARAALAELHARGVRTVLVEGGKTLAAAMLRRRLVDRIEWYVAPALLGEAGIPAVGDLGILTIGEALRMSIASLRQVGPDICVQVVPDRGGTEGADGVHGDR